jgi:uncharacterized protein with HEPN domain
LTKKDEIFIKHILDEVDFILEHSKNLNFEDLMKNEVLKRAFARSFEIIGEASKNLSEEFKQKHSNIEWKKIGRFRDKLIHAYFGVNWDIVWDFINNKLDELKREILKIV